MDNENQKRRILFVDDDQEFLDTLARLFEAWSQGTWQAHVAGTPAKALLVLQQRPIDLVVLDLEMPVMDGLQFLSLLGRKYPQLRKVILSGHSGDDYRAECVANGAELFLEKPRTQEGFESVFASLNELASLQPSSGFRGMLRHVGLQDLIQMECLARNSSILEIANGQVRGRIYVEQGAIVHAELGPVKGEAAFNNLLFLRGGEFNLRPFAAPPERTIDAQWEFLLMEASRMRDELEQLASAKAAETGTRPAPPGTATVSATPAGPSLETQVDEFIVCSGLGEVLYEWQCRDLEPRMKLLGLLSQKAGQLSQMFPLGRFDRLELLGPAGRVVVQLNQDRKLFLRCSQAPSESTAPPNP